MPTTSWTYLMKSCATGALFISSPSLAQTEAPVRDEAQEEPLNGDIVVTARKRGDELLQDVPQSITALGGDRLEDLGARSVSDVLQLSPSATVIEGSPGLQRIQVRGISTSFGDATVGYYLDELSFSLLREPLSPDAGAFDLERIEILKGPQGTLYGDGASGGVVRILTRQPQFNEFEVKTDTGLSFTRDGGTNYDLNGAVNVPLVDDRLAFRASVSYRDLSGWIDTPRLGLEDANDSQIATYRAKLRAAISDNFEATLGYWGSRIDNGGTSASFDDGTNDALLRERSRHDYDLYSLTLNIGAGPFALTSASSYLDYRTDRRNDIGGGTVFDYNFDVGNFTQEVRLSSDFNGPLQVTAGGFYRDIHQTSFYDVGGFTGNEVFNSEAWAVFGELSYDLSEVLEATIGLRYFEDRRDYVDVGLATGGADKYTSLNPRFNLAWTPSDNTLLYFNVAKGFRSGQIQDAFALLFAQLAGVDVPLSIEEEEVWAYEIGTKLDISTAFSLEAAAYLNNVTNLQTTAPLPQLPGLSVLVQGGKARIPGAELTMTARPARGFTASASVSWNDAQFRSTVPGAYTSGQRISFVPEWTLSQLLDYSTNINAGGWSLFGSYSGQYTSERINVTLGGTVPSDKVYKADLRLGVRRGGLEVAGFVNNLFNERGALAPVIAGTESTRYRPRTIGAALRTSF